MRKAIWRGTGRIDFVEEFGTRPPVENPSDVRIRVTVAGVCGTDVHIIDGKLKFVDPPLTLGHEFAGIVEECGPAVTRVHPGDRVKCDSVVGCGWCAGCRAGASQFCASGSEFGITRNGGWAEWLVAPERNLHVVPDAISDEVAAIMDVEVFGAIRKPGIVPGETVVVFGPGPAGLIALQAAKVMGAGTVIVCGTRPERLSVAKELGADHVINVRAANAVTAVRDLTAGRGADMAFDAAGTREAVVDGIAVLRPQGKLVLYGVHGTVVNDFPIDQMVLKDLVVYGALSNRTGWADLIEMIASGSIDLGRLITHSFPLESVRDAYVASSDRASGCLKSVLRITPSA